MVVICVVPVALRFVRLAVPPFSVAMFPVVKLPVIAVKVEASALENERVLPVRFETVVEPRVDEPVVKIFPNAPTPVTVVDPRFNAVIFPF